MNFQLFWKGHRQPTGGITFEAVKKYFDNAIATGSKRTDFVLKNQYGVLSLDTFNLSTWPEKDNLKYYTTTF